MYGEMKYEFTEDRDASIVTHKRQYLGSKPIVQNVQS
jgi:hypothetical protein